MLVEYNQAAQTPASPMSEIGDEDVQSVSTSKLTTATGIEQQSPPQVDSPLEQVLPATLALGELKSLGQRLLEACGQTTVPSLEKHLGAE